MPKIPSRKYVFPLLTAGLCLLGLGSFLILTEIGLRFFGPVNARRDRYYSTQIFYQYNPDWTQADSLLGFANIPNQQVRIIRPDIGGFDIWIRINSAGFRDDEASLNDPELLVLGDSFAFGWGVDGDETTEAILENLLDLRALNMGVSGYGTLQQYLLLRRWSEQMSLKGKDVVVLFYPNDWLEIIPNWAGIYPTVESYTTATLTTTRHSVEDLERFFKLINEGRLKGISRRSELVRLLRLAYTSLRAPRSAEGDPLLESLRPPHRPSETMRHAMDLVVRSMAALRDTDGFRLTFVYIPAAGYYEGEEWVDIEDLEKILNRYEIPLVNLRPILSLEDYWLLDRHWKPSGHRKCAMAIAQHFLFR